MGRDGDEDWKGEEEGFGLAGMEKSEEKSGSWRMKMGVDLKNFREIDKGREEENVGVR